MSVKVNLQLLSYEDMVNTINSLNYSTNNYMSSSSLFSMATPLMKALYCLKQDYVHVPYYYATRLLGMSHPNGNLVKTTIKPYIMKHNTQLLESQQHIVQLCLDSIAINGCCVLDTPAGRGKNVMSAYLSSIHSKDQQLLTLVVSSTMFACQQWLHTFTDLTTAEKVWFYNKKPDQQSLADIQVIICLKNNIQHMTDELKNNVGHLIIDANSNYKYDDLIALLGFTPKYITTITDTTNTTEKYYGNDNENKYLYDYFVGNKTIKQSVDKSSFILS